MLNEYECEKCGSICYTESEIWEFCPICEETPEERSLRKRAEQAEWERDRLREERNELQKRLNNFARDCGTTMSACPECGHGMSSRSGCLQCQRDKLREERDELLNALIDLLREASPYTPMSKHLLRECEDAEKTLEKLGGTN
jgi:chromosome segregation ATPase